MGEVEAWREHSKARDSTWFAAPHASRYHIRSRAHVSTHACTHVRMHTCTHPRLCIHSLGTTVDGIACTASAGTRFRSLVPATAVGSSTVKGIKQTRAYLASGPGAPTRCSQVPHLPATNTPQFESHQHGAPQVVEARAICGLNASCEQ